MRLLFFILPIILTNCGLQKPAPVSFKGEEFYGRRDLESIYEYHLTKTKLKNTPKNEKIVVKIYSHGIKSSKFVIPIEGKVVSKFQSIDEMCKEGVKIISHGRTEVIASAPGKVIYVGRGLRWYGNLIVVEHSDQYVTVYSYLKNMNVNIGDKVKQRQIIGFAGKSSVHDKNPQICFSIRHNGKSIDPLLQLK